MIIPTIGETLFSKFNDSPRLDWPSDLFLLLILLTLDLDKELTYMILLLVGFEFLDQRRRFLDFQKVFHVALD